MGKCKYLTFDIIESKANEFLKKYNPALKIPVPVEEIIEFDLKLDIFPAPFLYKDHGISSFLTIDRKEIWVDQLQFEQYEQKYRFSLAHETGHLILHNYIIKEGYAIISKTGSSVSNYLEWLNTLTGLDIEQMDFQANRFASYLLMPNPLLKNLFLKMYDSLISDPNFKDIERPFLLEALVEELSKVFNVSPKSLSLRILNDPALNSILNKTLKNE